MHPCRAPRTVLLAERALPRRMAAILFSLGVLFSVASQAELKPAVRDLSLREFIGLVLERNESVQERILEFEVNRKHYKAEQGVFEPELVLSYNRVENHQTNTAQQATSQ